MEREEGFYWATYKGNRDVLYFDKSFNCWFSIELGVQESVDSDDISDVNETKITE